MADVTAEAALTTNQTHAHPVRNVVFISDTIGYAFCINGDNDLDYIKTTDGGATWGAAVDIHTGTVEAFDVWYDQWTPGDTGRNIHIFFIDGGTADDVIYERLDTNTDTQAGEVIIVSTTSTVAGRGQFVSGAKMRGGNLMCIYDVDAGAEVGHYRSVDNGVTWDSRVAIVEATIDQGLYFPANVADANDGWILYHDASTDELTLKEYDDSANTVAESSPLTMAEETTDGTGQYGFSGAIRHSDGHLIVAYMSTYDAAGGGTTAFNVYDMNGTGSLTALTAIATGVDHIYYPSVYLNQDQPDWIYVANLGVSAGTSTLTTSMPCVYHLSKDRGITWTRDIAYSESTTDYKCTWTPLNGERFIVMWLDISASSFVTNHVNSKGFGYTRMNNYQSISVKDGMSTTEKIR